MNVIDRVINAFSPERGLRRAAARRKLGIIENSGYSNYGASRTKKGLIGWLYGGGSASEDIEENLSALRERSRDLYMGVPLATGAIKTMRTNVVGSGLVLKSQVDYSYLGISEEAAQEIEGNIEREFSLWADSHGCDLERTDNFRKLQQLAFMNWLLSGDVFVALPTTQRPDMPYDLRIQLIEADRVCNPPNKEDDRNIVGGVETNRHGEVVAYHIANSHPLSVDAATSDPKDWKRVSAYGEKTGGAM